MSAARSKTVGQVFDIGVDILCTTIDPSTGMLSAQTGDSTTQTPDSDKSEWWQHTGFSSRPATPSVGNASCQGIVLKQNDRDQVIATRDVRGTAILGNLADGETCVYASGAQGRTVWKADGSVRDMTTDNNKSTGNAVFAGISPYYQTASGKPALGGEWRYYAPWGGQWQDPTGWHLRTFTGVKIDAGGVTLPSPISLGGSQFSVSADMGLLDFATVLLGRNNGTGQALVQALPLQAVMTSLASFLSTAGSELTIAGAAMQGAGTPGAAGVSAAGSALTSAAGVIGSGTISPACATKATTAT
jgi:hypothetical protein